MEKEKEVLDKNIENYKNLLPPEEIVKQYPLNENIKDFINKKRNEISSILSGNDPRIILIIGPCSIHNVSEGLEYAKKISELNKKISDKFCLVMRTYFEKPRTSIGWKGLINDPYLDGSFNIEEGIIKAREFLIKVNSLGVPCATEFLDPIIPQYLADLVSWSAIGARTVESQTHREMASGLSMPVGFKNSTTGEIKNAVNAILSIKTSHGFLGIDRKGKVSKVISKGNNFGHLILRGGNINNKKITNYQKEEIKNSLDVLEKNNLQKSLIVDCSHGNSMKDYKKQPSVFSEVVSQYAEGEEGIKGLMLESNLFEGKQKLPEVSSLKYGSIFENIKRGVSITDACLGWEETERVILENYKKL